MRSSELVRLLGIKCCVDAAKDHPSPAASRQLANFIAAQGVARMNADAHHVTIRTPERIKWLQGFVDEVRISVRSRRRRGKDIQPARRNYRRAKRNITGIYQVDLHASQGSLWRNGKDCRACPHRSRCSF